MQVARRTASTRDPKEQIETDIAGARVLDQRNSRALVKLPRGIDRTRGAARTDFVSTALGSGESVAPILYEKGQPQDERWRRVGTAEVLVQARPGETAEKLRGIGAARAARETNVPGRIMLTFPNPYSALAAAQRLRQLGYEADAQLARLVSRRAVPNDPFFPNQWHLRNLGQSNGLPGADIDPIRAWDFSRGAGVTVAVVDDGVQLIHPDLSSNALPLTMAGGVHPHRDFNDADDNPAPGPFDAHGTACAGVAAARGFNGAGVSGGAPEAGLIGLRLISDAFTDQDSANALFWKPAGVTVGVSSNSWGPFDDPHLGGPDILTRQAMQDAAQQGRGGKGVVIVFAAGNGLRNDDNVALDGYASSKFALAVGAVTNRAVQSPYSEPGSAMAVVAPSNGGSLGIFTTDVSGNSGYNPQSGGQPANRDYTNSFGGTSSAAPLVSGSVAVLLAANPDLSYRDVKEILMSTARKIDAADGDWVQNGAGFHFNHKYGAGMVNLTAALARAKDWTPLAPEEVQQLDAGSVPVAIPETTDGVTRTFNFPAGTNLRVEHVEAVVKIAHARRNDLEITLQSPSGTQSVLVNARALPDSDDNRDYADGNAGWIFMSTHHWGENSAGLWTLRVRDRSGGVVGTLQTAQVRVYGTPESTTRRVAFENQVESSSEPGGSKVVRLRRLGNSSGPVSVDYAVSSVSTAAAGEDFTLAEGTAQFADGQTELEIGLTILDDGQAEGTEAIHLLLKNPVGAALGGTTEAVITIADNEGTPVMASAPDAAASESSSGTNPGVFTISRPFPEAGELTVNYTLSGSASPSDYTVSGSATIPAGGTSTNITVVPTDDGTIEGGETVVLTIEPALTDDYVIGTPSSAEILLADNDLSRVELSAAAGSISEGSPTPLAITISRGAAETESALVVSLKTSGSAIPGVHYFALPEQVEIPAGQLSVVVPLQPKDDTSYQAVKAVKVELAASSDYTIGFNRAANIFILENDPQPDAVAPEVSISSPIIKSRINAPAVVIASGTASDNTGIASVIYELNQKGPHPASGTSNWTADLSEDLNVGPNLLTVFSKDVDGNESEPVNIVFDYVQPRLLTVSVAGSGSVSRGFAPQVILEAGQTYEIQAKPERGFVFGGWTGDLTAPTREFVFRMPDDETHLVANFVPDPFVAPLTGFYTGAVRAAELSFETTGLLQLAVNAKGSSTGKLLLAGATIPLRGEFNGAGKFRTTILRKGSTPLTLDLELDLSGATRQITGTLATPASTFGVVAERAAFSRSVPYPLVTSHPSGEIYHFILPPSASASGVNPKGTGYGTARIDKAGNVKWSAMLADGSKASGAVPLNASGGWVLHSPLANKRGVLLGDILLDKSAPVATMNASVDWLRIVDPKAKLFPGGFEMEDIAFLGSLYTPPIRDGAVTAFGSGAISGGTIILRDGNLSTLQRRAFGLTSTQQPQVNNAGNPQLDLKVKVDAAKGLFSGSFLDPNFIQTKVTRKFAGVFLQNIQEAHGGFVGATANGTNVQTGTVILDPTP